MLFNDDLVITYILSGFLLASVSLFDYEKVNKC